MEIFTSLIFHILITQDILITASELDFKKVKQLLK